MLGLCTLMSCSSDAQKSVDEQIAELKQNLPQSFSDDLTWTDVVQENDFVCYLYDMKATFIPKGEDTLRNQLKEASADKDFSNFLNSVIESGRGICYRYKNMSTGAVIEYKFSPEELVRIIRQ